MPIRAAHPAARCCASPIRCARSKPSVARRARRANARIVAVTGSVGKTGTKEMLRLCLALAGPTHAAEKSYNNHWGVPLTLARMPADAQYAVLEIGMNHRRRDRAALRDGAAARGPHHHGRAGAPGLLPLGRGDRRSQGGDFHRPRARRRRRASPRQPAFPLVARARSSVGAKIVTFGYHNEADFRALQVDLGPKGSSVIAGHGTQRFPYRVGAPGEHYVKNSLGVLATLHALGADAMRCLPGLARVSAPVGRGARTLLDAPDGQILLIDESYNANPASVRAALAAMAATPREAFARRVAVLGDMLELGTAAPELHRALKEAVDEASVDLVLACGPMMRHLFDDLARAQQGAWAPSSTELVPALLEAVRAGDVVMIKGSLGTRMAPLVEAMVARFGPGRPGG